MIAFTFTLTCSVLWLTPVFRCSRSVLTTTVRWVVKPMMTTMNIVVFTRCSSTSAVPWLPRCRPETATPPHCHVKVASTSGAPSGYTPPPITYLLNFCWSTPTEHPQHSRRYFVSSKLYSWVTTTSTWWFACVRVDWKRGSGKRCTIKIAGVENAGVENVAPSSRAYSLFQDFKLGGVKYESPPGESRGKTPVGSLKTAPRSSSLFVYESINFTSAIAQKTMQAVILL